MNIQEKIPTIKHLSAARGAEFYENRHKCPFYKLDYVGSVARVSVNRCVVCGSNEMWCFDNYCRGNLSRGKERLIEKIENTYKDATGIIFPPEAARNYFSWEHGEITWLGDFPLQRGGRWWMKESESMTREGARAGGVVELVCTERMKDVSGLTWEFQESRRDGETAKEAYARCVDEIYGAGTWDGNPMVKRIYFGENEIYRRTEWRGTVKTIEEVLK